MGISTVPDAFIRPIRRPLAATALAAGTLLFALTAGPAAASPSDLAALPTQVDFGCLACHSGSQSTASSVAPAEASQLNAFGQDWLLRGRVWSPALATENSDGDGCSNGYELGDPTGHWVPADGYLPVPPSELRNPGIPGDCLLPIGERSFGILKGLFRAD